MKEDSLQYKFLLKHYELLKETATPQSLCESIEPEKTPKSAYTREELETEESKTSTVVRHKLMSLLTLVKEFTNKKLKNNAKNCSDCMKIGSCCSKCYNLDDEDDDSPDFNFVLPKKLKPHSHSSNFKNKENGIPSKKGSNATTAGKYKLWKMDYYRQKDRDAMSDISKQLKRHRKKHKSAHMKLLIKSSSKGPPKPSSKPSTKPSSKSGPKVQPKGGPKYGSKPASGHSKAKYRR